MLFPNKYTHLIDAETWAFIKKTQNWYPPEAVNFPIARQREVYDDLCQAFAAKFPNEVETQDITIAGPQHDIPCRSYSREDNVNENAQILYFHGGGFVVGGLHSHDSYCAEICKATGFNLTAIDYRLAPEHIFPADYYDVVAAYRHLINQSQKPIILLGDSAGGNLAAALAHASRQEVRQPVGQVLVYPTLGSDWTKGSYLEHAEAPMLTTDEMIYYAKMRTGGDLSMWSQKELSPLYDADLTNLPPTIVFSAQCDPLRDDGFNYCAKIVQAGGKAQFFEETGLVHSYLLARHSVGRAKRAFENIVTALTLLGQQIWQNP
ncbi:MAG: alpha/beta hydrolase fold domain-containing protein [Rhizobiaceae bacterium]|nr:alpha/beta hydrolase fold domain-containing protein [Rhizobiaceae bacterium]